MLLKTRHHLNAGRGKPLPRELVPRGLVNDLACFIVGAALWTALGWPVPGGIDLSYAFI
jgi:hypothetical protein